MTWIEWVEPFGPDDEPAYVRVSKETAIAWQRASAAKRGFIYPTDQMALDDFLAVYWATEREETCK